MFSLIYIASGVEHVYTQQIPLASELIGLRGLGVS